MMKHSQTCKSVCSLVQGVLQGLGVCLMYPSPPYRDVCSVLCVCLCVVFVCLCVRYHVVVHTHLVPALMCSV